MRLVADERVAAFDSEDAQMKRALLERSGSVAIAVLNEKLLHQYLFTWARLNVVSDLAIEADAEKQVVSHFASRGVRVHRANGLSWKADRRPHIS